LRVENTLSLFNSSVGKQKAGEIVVNESFIPTVITDKTSMVFTTDGFMYALIFSFFILLFMLAPYIIELKYAYDLARKRDEQAKELLEHSITNFIASSKLNNCSLTDEQLDKFYEKVFAPIQDTLRPPVTGVAGSTRGIIAFAIIFTIGITTMLVMFAKEGDPQLVNNIISMLAATLATIVGFYFGGRTVQEATQAEKAKTQQSGKQPPSVTQSPPATERMIPETPDLKVRGIKVGALSKTEGGGVTPITDVNIFEFWDTYDKKEFEYSMDPKTEYSLYCCVESSIPEGRYNIYIEPVLKKGFESILFLKGLRDAYRAMTPHEKQNTWYVDSFGWIPEYSNWRKPGKYQVILKIGYLKKGKPLGTPPIWLKEEEFTIILK
jgi:hypothetical protein